MLRPENSLLDGPAEVWGLNSHPRDSFDSVLRRGAKMLINNCRPTTWKFPDGESHTYRQRLVTAYSIGTIDNPMSEFDPRATIVHVRTAENREAKDPRYQYLVTTADVFGNSITHWQTAKAPAKEEGGALRFELVPKYILRYQEGYPDQPPVREQHLDWATEERLGATALLTINSASFGPRGYFRDIDCGWGAEVLCDAGELLRTLNLHEPQQLEVVAVSPQNPEIEPITAAAAA